MRSMMPNIVLYRRACTASCTIDFHNLGCYHVLMKADLRISVKDYRRNKNLKILIQRAFFHTANFMCA
jgi:hypothetical protein